MTLACKTRLSRTLTLTSYLGLLLLFTLWYLFVAPANSSHPWVIWLVHLVPLLAFAPSVLRGNPRGHAWLCFVLLLYFMEAVLAALTPSRQWLGLIESLLIVILFTSSMLFARWRSRLNKHSAPRQAAT